MTFIYLQIKVLNVEHFVYFGDYILTIIKNKNTYSFPADDCSTVLMSLIHFLSLKDEIELHCSKDMGTNSAQCFRYLFQSLNI